MVGHNRRSGRRKRQSPAYRKTVLPNGLKVITEALPYVRSISVGFWADVGSRDETDSSAGISHFIEHMAFKGTRNRTASEIASFLESVGGVLNAFTSREQTCYHAKILDQHLGTAVDILSDLVNNPRFDPREIEKEKGVILEEIRDVEDSPSDLVHDLFAKAIFGSHPLGRPIMGSRTTVDALNRRKIMRFVHKHYTPDKIVVAASGNLDHDHLVELVARQFDSKPARAAANSRKPPKFKPHRRVYPRKTSQAHICLGVPAKDFNHPSRTAMLLLNSILGGGMSSRLFQGLRENLGLAYNVFSYLDFFQDNGILGIYVGTDRRNVIPCLRAILVQIRDLCKNRLSPRELDKAKAHLKGNLMLGLENTSNRMNRLAKHEFLTGRYIDLDETVAAIDAVRPDHITEIAREIFIDGNFSAAALGPMKNQIYSPLD